jgi:hypothetical protein
MVTLMSAFIVSDYHIGQLVNAAITPPSDAAHIGHFGRFYFYHGGASYDVNHDTATAIGQALVNQNYASVNYRYNESDPADRFTYVRGLPRLTIVQVLKAIHCYEYQSCEDGGWEVSMAKAFCDALTTRLINLLPGYEEADWSLPAA